MNRRSFLQSILAAGVAPWVMSNGVAGGVLMPVRKIVLPSLMQSVAINLRGENFSRQQVAELIEEINRVLNESAQVRLI